MLAHSFALFCIYQKPNSFVSNRFRTLCAETRGWGILLPRSPRPPSSANGEGHPGSPCRERRGAPPVPIFTSLLPYILASLLLSSTISPLPAEVQMSFSQRLDDIRTGFERPFWVANIT